MAAVFIQGAGLFVVGCYALLSKPRVVGLGLAFCAIGGFELLGFIGWLAHP